MCFYISPLHLLTVSFLSALLHHALADSFDSTTPAPSTSSSPSQGEEFPVKSLNSIDGAVIATYFFILLSIGFRDLWWQRVKRWYTRWFRQRYHHHAFGGDEAQREESGGASGYFLAAREMKAYAVGASLFASNIGSEHFVGLAGSGASIGLAVGWFEWTAPFSLMLLAWVFVPLYLHGHVFTMPEYMQRRFGGQRIGLAITIVSLGLYIFTKISVSLYAGGIIFHTVLGLNQYVVAVILIIITGTYTALGGLRAVIYTEVFNTFALLGGGLLLFAVCMYHVNGLSGLEHNSNVPSSYFHMFRSPSDADFPWTGMVFGMWTTSIWYWCADQNIVQRVLCADSEETARWGVLITSCLKVLPMFIMVVPGIVARALFPHALSEAGADSAYPTLVTRLLPHGLMGLMCASM